MATCKYVAGYVNKKMGDPDTFNLMSRRPGIGRGWLLKYKQDIINTETVVIDGQEVPIPKKYLEWYESDFSEIKNKRKQYFKDQTPDEVWKNRVKHRTREKILKSKLQQKSEVL